MELVKTSYFKKIYSDMLFQFPASELKQYEKFQKILGENYSAYDVIEDGIPVGYVVLFLWNDFIFIDYVAIFKEFQSKGYGGKILETLKEKFNSKKGCFLEVEKPDESKPNTLRRIRFYQKHGAEKIGINYLYPNETGFLPMDLYYIKYSVPAEYQETRDFIEKLFEIVHGDLMHSKEVLSKIFN